MRYLIILTLAQLLNACVTTPKDRSKFKEMMPTSILVLPPANHSPDVSATQTYLSVISRPMAEQGFYIFPVAVVDSYFKENGLSTPAEIHNVPLEKLREVFNADAVFYPTIEEWGSSYELVASTTRVRISAKLLDTRTGSLLWSGDQVRVKSDSSSEGGLAGMLIGAAISQIINDSTDQSKELARQGSYLMIQHSEQGFLKGPLDKKSMSGQKSDVSNTESRKAAK